MRYILEDLLHLRSIREKEAYVEVRKATHLHEIALTNLKRVEVELEKYRHYRMEQGATLFAGIKNKEVSVHDLKELQQTCNLLREKEAALEREVLEAEEMEDEARQKLETAKFHCQKVAREKRKIEEHQRIWLEAYKKERERVEEKETEDFRGKMLLVTDEEDGNNESW